MKRFVFSFALTLACLGTVAQTPSAPWPTEKWTTAAPEATGMDSGALADLVDYLATPSFRTDSILVVRQGRLVTEAYAAPVHADLRHDLRSVTKSVVATLVGAAIQQGKIQSDAQPALAFFPQHKPNSTVQSEITVRHLLDMRSGIQWKEWPYNPDSDAYKLWGAPDWTGFILARDVAAPGEKFQYVAAAPHLLSVILTRATGSKAADYGRQHVFKAMGIESLFWRDDPQGHSVGEAALGLRPRDMAKIGLLHLRQGRWEGQQLLPPGWAESLFTQQGPPHGVNPLHTPPTYRNLWWTDAAVPYAAAIGRHGQYIIVLPKQDVVLVVTSKTADPVRGASVPELVRKHLLVAAKSDGPLPPDAAGQARLAEALRRFAENRDDPTQTPTPAALAQSRMEYVLEPNAWNLLEFSLELTASEPHYRVVKEDKKALTGRVVQGGVIGLEGQYVVSPRASDRLWARRGRWLDNSTFRVEAQFMEGAVVAEWTARFLGNGQVELSYLNGDGESLTVKGRAKGLPATSALYTPQVVSKTAPPVEITDTARLFTEDALRNGVRATQAQCQQVTNGVWAAAPQGPAECLRVWTSGFTPGVRVARAVVFFSGDLWSNGRAIPESLSMSDQVLETFAGNWAKRLQLPYIFIARPGTYGSSGDHMERRRPAESQLVSAALDVLKAKFGVSEYVLVGFSGGGHLTSALVTLRADVVCAVPGGSVGSPRMRWALHGWTADATGYSDSYEPVDHLRKDDVHPKLRILVVGDPRDRNAVWPAQIVMADKARQQGLTADVIEVQGTPPDYHGGQGEIVRLIAGWCAQDLPLEEIRKRSSAYRLGTAP